MYIYRQIREELQKQYRSSSQIEMARRLGVSQAHIGRLINGNAPIESLKLSTLQKLLGNRQLIIDNPARHDSLERMLGRLTEDERRQALKILHACFPDYAEEE